MKLGLSFFLDLYILMTRNFKCLLCVFSLLFKAKRSSYVACNYYTLLLKFHIVPFELFAYLILSRTSKLMDNRQTDFLSLNMVPCIEQAKILAFSNDRNFRSLPRVYSLRYAFFAMLLICSLKFNFELIVILSSATDEADFMVILLICNLCEPVFPRVIN